MRNFESVAHKGVCIKLSMGQCFFFCIFRVSLTYLKARGTFGKFIIAKLLRAEGGAPYLRKFGNLSISKILVVTR